MINREITYERSVSRSYMKIPACLEASFDEEIMLGKEIPGFLQVEKCYINSMGQYWYNITGKQALDSYTKMKSIGITFIEKLLLNICSQIEKLEWNLLGTTCLVLEPELIFIANGSEEIYFTLYPENKGDAYAELTKLMEYLLTRLDHKDTEAVKTAYGIYELTLSEGYSLSDIRNAIEKNKNISEPAKIKKADVWEHGDTPEISTEKVFVSSCEPEKKNKWQKVEKCSNTLQELWKKAMEILKKEAGIKRKKATPLVTYPEPEEATAFIRSDVKIVEMPATNPTVCLVSAEGNAKGILLHEGLGEYPDYELSLDKCEIGNNVKANLFIKKDTVSNSHATIEYDQGHYYIEDLNSTNGTYVNGVPINYKQREKLNPGDEIRFADVRYRFM